MLLHSHPLSRPPSPVCPVLLCSLILPVYWVFNVFSSPNTPNILLLCPSLFLYITSSLSSGLPCLLTLLRPSLSPHSPLRHLYSSDTTFSHANSTLRPGLCCAVAVHRSERDRWSRMISGLCSFLRGTAWYCCWHDALSGLSAGPRVEHFHPSWNTSVKFR